MKTRFHTDAAFMKIKGCSLEFWGGFVGLSDKLAVFDGDIPCCVATDLSKRSREALADGMIELWKRFRAGEVDPSLKGKV